MKKYKPVTPAMRGTVLVSRVGLWKGSPEKTLSCGMARSGGRNNKGRITVRGRGHKGTRCVYRKVAFNSWGHKGIQGEVLRLEYDPNRTGYIALIKYEVEPGKFELSYVLAVDGLRVGSHIVADDFVPIEPGNVAPLRNLPVGIRVCNVGMYPDKGGQIARSAGSSVRYLGVYESSALIETPSGEKRLVPLNCFATIGVVSNPEHLNTKYGCAGRTRRLGFSPKVRGVAMNPVDHPHGGGEGRSSGGRHPVSPKGKPTKGAKTRFNRRTDSRIVEGRKRGKRS